MEQRVQRHLMWMYARLSCRQRKSCIEIEAEKLLNISPVERKQLDDYDNKGN